MGKKTKTIKIVIDLEAWQFPKSRIGVLPTKIVSNKKKKSKVKKDERRMVEL